MGQVGQYFWQKRYWFGEVDTRPVALFRIAFGLILLKDVIYHLFVAQLYYSGDGILPDGRRFTLWPPDQFSLFHISESTFWAQLLMVVWIVAVFSLVLGFHTRLATIINWLLIVSAHERTPQVLNGADVVFLVMSFWMLFLPLAEHYSLDSRRRGGGRPLAYALPVRLAQLQICLVYFQTGVLKLPSPAWYDGNALYAALHQSYLTSGLTDWVIGWLPGWIYVGFGLFTLVVEVAFPLWIYFPLKQPKIRWVALIGGYLLHIGILILMAVPNFSWVMMSSYFLFWEGSWVERMLGMFGLKQTSWQAESAAIRPRWQRLLLTGGALVRDVWCDMGRCPGNRAGSSTKSWGIHGDDGANGKGWPKDGRCSRRDRHCIRISGSWWLASMRMAGR